MTLKIDFELIARAALSNGSTLVSSWLPGGKLVGKEWTCASLSGDAGESLKVNLTTGKWADFATGEKGRDLISLYASIRKIKNSDAALELGGHNLKKKLTLVPPPEAEPAPTMSTKKFGDPTLKHCYQNKEGRVLFWIARYDLPDGRKQFLPWAWHGEKKSWITKSWDEPRPLFNLPALHNNNEATVILVEGEKSVDYVKRLLGDRVSYVASTWPGGAQAWDKADWSPLIGRNVLVWPDADSAGIEAADKITAHLKKIGVKGLKRIQVSENGGWDVADAVADGWDWKRVAEWARARIETIDVTVQIQINNNFAAHEEDAAVIPPSLAEKYDLCGIYTTKGGKPIVSAAVLCGLFIKWPPLNNFVWRDEFHRRIFTTFGTKTPRPWDADLDPINLMVYLQSTFQFHELSCNTVREAVSSYASKRIKNEPCDWVKTLRWDGCDRISDFFTIFFGVEKNPYSEAVSKNFWVAIMARLFNPGCQVDEMVILEGAQGSFKSSALEIIGGRYYSLANGSVDSKDFMQGLWGRMIVEIAELEGFNRAEERAIKKAITGRSDVFRAPYEREVREHRRSCVLVGTTNEADYLKDHTGARRFWPLKVDYINRDLLKAERNQLFAEAYMRYARGDSWHETPKDITLNEQEARRETDEWENDIRGYAKNRDFIIISELALKALGIELAQLSTFEQRRIKRILKTIGWAASNRSQRVGEHVRHVWRPVNPL